jgi:D-alanyl-D-alanine carboxypeptidase/D-alanyl-D-alanine-endopeptidase (penicillin-binding protein 4)
VRRVRLAYDASLFTGPPGSEGWRADYLPDGVVSPIAALWVDEGRAANGWQRVSDPPQRAADLFAAALVRAGVKVRGPVVPGVAPTDGTELAVATSAPLSQIVERILDVSDNEAAEVLGHQVGLATGGEGSFAGGAEGVTRTLTDLGVRMRGVRLLDGSGLSRRTRMEVDTLLDVLRLAASPDHPDLRPVVTGLPVAGFTGSLTYRFDDVPVTGRGTVRAKTGTLTGVSSLAGLATDADGSTVVFVVAADKVEVEDTLAARAALDDAAGALGACACG